MRQFKFRAWDEKNKVMHYDFQFIKSGEEGNDWILFVSDKQPISNYEGWLKNPYFQQQLKIMQWIGKRDKNDVEIYEGDIVIVPADYFGDHWCKEVRGVVTYEDDRFYVHNPNDKHGITSQEVYWEKVTNIGDIYQHAAAI